MNLVGWLYGVTLNIFYCSKGQKDKTQVEQLRQSSPFMVFNATFNNISVILWRSVLLEEEKGGPGENHLPVTSH